MDNNNSQPMTLAQMEELAWRSAIDHYLSEYPDHLDTDTIVELVADDNERVTVWEPFEHWDGDSVANAIEEMRGCLLSDYKRVAGIEV